MKILHLINDWWLTDCVVSDFKPLGFENQFVCFCSPDKLGEPFKIAKSSNDLKRVAVGSKEYDELLRPGTWDLVWIHGLHGSKIPFLCALDQETKVMWSTWGFDYLDLQVQWMYGLRTSLYLAQHSSLRTIVKTLIQWVVAKFRLTLYLPRKVNQVFSKISYFSSVVPTEEPLVRKLIGKGPKWFPFHCVKRQGTLQNYPVVDLDSKRMIVGNSAYDTCNHLDAFRLVRSASDYEIWSPLSYTFQGIGKSSYADDVIKEGIRLFGERFHPITQMMPFDEYVKWLSTCSVYVYPNKRQQALGNISMALRMGGCVFLDKRNPIYQYYKANGVRVYALSEFKNLENILMQFRPYQKENVAKVNELRSHDRLIGEVDETIRCLCRETSKSL